jgi:hypothetical protein
MLISLTAFGLALFAALAPETEWDALAYHLWLPKLWLQSGGQVDLTWEFFSLFPLTWELLFGAGLSLGGPVTAKLLHYCCLPLISLVLYETSRRYFRAKSCWLTVAYFVTIPTVFWEATTAYIDLALTFHIMLTLVALFRYIECRRWQWLFLSAINLGLALATKHHALFVLAFAPVYLAVHLWREERRLLRALRPAVLLLAGSLLLPGPWYYRSWHASRNPVFPLLFNTFGAQPPSRWDAKIDRDFKDKNSNMGQARSPSLYIRLPWEVTVHATYYQGSLGPIFLMLLPAFLITACRVSILPLIATFAISYFVFWASPLATFEIRYLIPITPFLALLATGATERMRSILRARGRKLLDWALGILLVLNFPYLIFLQEGNRVGWKHWFGNVIHELPAAVVLGLENQDDYLIRKVSSYKAWRYMNLYLPPDARVLSFTDENYYAERQRISDYAVPVRSAAWNERSTDEQARECLRQQQITHILLDKNRQLELVRMNMPLGRSSFVERWLVRDYEDLYWIVYRVRE